MERAWGKGVPPMLHKSLGNGMSKEGEGGGLVQSQGRPGVWPGVGVKGHEITAQE